MVERYPVRAPAHRFPTCLVALLAAAIAVAGPSAGKVHAQPADPAQVDNASLASADVPSRIVIVVAEGLSQDAATSSSLPSLERIGAAGVWFSDVVSSSPCTASAWASLANARWPRRTEPVANPFDLGRSFADLGYRASGSEADSAAEPGARALTIIGHPPPQDVSVAVYEQWTADLERKLNALDASLQATDAADSTLVVVVGTHGFDRSDRGFEPCASLSASSLGVPLVLRWPGRLPAETRVRATVSLIDVMPTVRALAGGRPDPSAEGQSLLPLIDASDAPSRLGYQRRPAFAVLRGESTAEAIFHNDWKLVRRESGLAGTYALFDHASDRANTRNVASRHPDLVRRLTARLDRWLERIGDDVPGVESGET